VVDAMPTIPASSWPEPPDGVAATDLTWAETVPGGGYSHKVLARGTDLRLTDLDGDACAHVLLFNADAPWERLNVADTVKVQWNAYLGESMALLSDQGRVLATVVSDESRRHDALCGTSVEGLASFNVAAAKNGLTSRDLPPSISLFQGVRVGESGELEFMGSAGAARSVTLRTELPLIVLIANSAHPLDPRTHPPVSPLQLLAWRSKPSTADSPEWTSTPEARRAFENTADYLTARGME
jgi:uncharacterized protein YcgI (DUF1989 family)